MWFVTSVTCGVVYLLLLAHIVPTLALIPKVCVNNITAVGASGVCCPTPKGAIEPCGGFGVGTCQEIYIQVERLPVYRLQDDRMNWPSRFFRYACKCEGNYFGIACETCWYGWSGPLCNRRLKHVRRDIRSFSKKERKMFVNIVAEMPRTPTDFVVLFEKDVIYSDPLWRPKFVEADLQFLIAYLHRYASRSTMYKNEAQCTNIPKLDNNHGVIGFNTWHRYYVLFWEKELRKIAIKKYGWYEFAFPYWDWVDSTKCDVCINSLVGAPGPWVNGIRLLHPESPFSKWTEYCTSPNVEHYCFGCHATWPNFRPLNRHYFANSFPTTAELQYALSLKDYYLPQDVEDRGKCRGFHQALEGFCGAPGTNASKLYMHNKVHDMVHGSFCCSATAGNDPIFILHHSQIDRVLQVWYQRYRPTVSAYPNHGVEMGNCRECNIIGFLPLVKHADMFTDMRNLGIFYDNYKFGNKRFNGDLFIKYGSAYGT